jgi:cobalt-zinc-cadmium efflux system outer membrane protein
MRLYFSLFSLALSLPLVFGQDLTEGQVLVKLSAESPRARALALQVQLARASAQTEGLPPNPTLTLSREAAGGTPETYLLYEQPLSVTGRRRYLRRAAEASAESESMSVRMQLHNLRVDVRLAFLELLLAQEKVALYESEKTRLAEVVDILRKREKSGESSGYDRIRAERELSLLDADQGEAEARSEHARTLLASFFGAAQSPQTLRAVGTLAIPTFPDVETIIARSANRGDIQAAYQQAESSSLTIEAARRKRYPEPVVSGGMKSPVINGQRDSGYVFGIDIPIPLFDRGKADMTRAEIARRAAVARAEAIKVEVGLKLRGSWEEARTRVRVAGLYRDRAVAQTEDLVRIARAAYEGGEVGILELLDAYRTQREVKLRMQDLTAAAKQSALELERLAGEEVIP